MIHNYRKEKGTAFDLSTTSHWVIAMNGDNVASVQATRFGPWTTAAMTVQRSNDGVNPVDLATPVTLGPPAGATVLSVMTAANLDIGGFEFLHIQVPVANTEASALCDLIVNTNRV